MLGRQPLNRQNVSHPIPSLHSSGPAMTASSRARSAPLRAIGPITERSPRTAIGAVPR